MTPEPVPVVPLRVMPAIVRPRRHWFPPHLVAARVCKTWGVTFEAVSGRGKGAQLCAARRDLVRQLRSMTAMSLAEIGVYLGGRDHSTILHLTKGR